VRCIVAEQLGIADDRRTATEKSPGLPKVGMVAPPADYVTTGGRRIPAAEMDLHGRLMSMQTAHRSYMVTGAICTGAAAGLEGTLVHQVTRSGGAEPERVRIAHPYGVMDVGVRAAGNGADRTITSVSVGRTARHIMDGEFWVPAALLEDRQLAAASA
jgi:2-methylaconitate cis-trans-isomerase PrpF